MKPRIVLQLVLAATASLTTIKAAAAEPPKTTGQPAEKTSIEKVQPHSNLQEKNGGLPQKKTDKAKQDKKQDARSAAMAQGMATPPKPKSVTSQGGKPRADKDKTRHFHPRDAK